MLDHHPSCGKSTKYCTANMLETPGGRLKEHRTGTPLRALGGLAGCLHECDSFLCGDAGDDDAGDGDGDGDGGGDGDGDGGGGGGGGAVGALVGAVGAVVG